MSLRRRSPIDSSSSPAPNPTHVSFSLPDLSTLDIGGPTTKQPPGASNGTFLAGAINKVKGLPRATSQTIKKALLQVANVQSNKWKDLEGKIRNKMKAFAGDDSFVESHVRSYLERHYYEYFSIYETTEKKKQQDEVVERVAKGVKEALSEIADTPLEPQFAQQDVYNIPTGDNLGDGHREKLFNMFWECYDQVINGLDEKGLRKYSRYDLTQKVVKKMKDEKYKQVFGAVAASCQQAMQVYSPDDLRAKNRISIDVNFIPHSTGRSPASVLAPEPHMDRIISDDHRNLTRYGRKLGQDSPKDILLTWFWFGFENGKPVVLECPTKIYSGVPVVNIDMMRDVVQRLVEPVAGGLTTLQAEEMVTQLLERATTNILSGDTGVDLYNPDSNTGGDDSLKDAGISVYDAPPNKWTNANTVLFHRSPSKDEVAKSGNVSRLLRVFIAGILVEEDDKDNIVYSETNPTTGLTKQVSVRMPAYLDPEHTNKKTLEDAKMRVAVRGPPPPPHPPPPPGHGAHFFLEAVRRN